MIEQGPQRERECIAAANWLECYRRQETFEAHDTEMNEVFSDGSVSCWRTMSSARSSLLGGVTHKVLLVGSLGDSSLALGISTAYRWQEALCIQLQHRTGSSELRGSLALGAAGLELDDLSYGRRVHRVRQSGDCLAGILRRFFRSLRSTLRFQRAPGNDVFFAWHSCVPCRLILTISAVILCIASIRPSWPFWLIL